MGKKDRVVKNLLTEFKKLLRNLDKRKQTNKKFFIFKKYLHMFL